MDFLLYFQNVIWPEGGGAKFINNIFIFKAKHAQICHRFGGNVGAT